MNPTRCISMEFPADPALLVIPCGAVRELARLAGFSERECQRLEVATDEICTNVVTHAYEHDRSQRYRVEAEITTECLEVRIYDKGDGFEMADVPEPPMHAAIEEIKIGGLGLCLCRKMMDEVTSFRTAAGEHCVRLVKRLPVNLAAAGG